MNFCIKRIPLSRTQDLQRHQKDGGMRNRDTLHKQNATLSLVAFNRAKKGSGTSKSLDFAAGPL